MAATNGKLSAVNGSLMLPSDHGLLGPLKPTGTLAERTADVVRARILAGDFRLGERLVEGSIAGQLGISRGPVREALKQLRAEGLVDELPRRGSFVVEPSEVDVAEIYDLRAAIEARCVRLVIERGVSTAPIARALDGMRTAAAGGDRERFSQRDLAFHETICAACGNERLHRLFVGYASMLGLLLRLERKRHHVSLPDMIPEHERIHDAIAAGDPEQAELACDEHLESAKQRLLAERLDAVVTTGSEEKGTR
jgi:DNA-binding GntR family transcriptional regulator